MLDTIDQKQGLELLESHTMGKRATEGEVGRQRALQIADLGRTVLTQHKFGTK